MHLQDESLITVRGKQIQEGFPFGYYLWGIWILLSEKNKIEKCA